MQRTFLTNLFLLLVLNLLVKPFYILGIDAGVQDAVGSEEYGGYAAFEPRQGLLFSYQGIPASRRVSMGIRPKAPCSADLPAQRLRTNSLRRFEG